MKAKILLILLILLSFTVIGCVDDEEETPIENDTDNMTSDDVVNETANDTDMNVTVEETEDEKLEITEYEGARTYTIYMENFLTQPGNVTLNKGDSVMWFNRNEPKRIFTVVSNEGLWENKSLGYRLSFTHTFNESGTYTYHVPGWESRMKGTITVK